MTSSHVAVIGAGAWGTALARHLALSGVTTTMWAREPEVVASIGQEHQNKLFLPGIMLPPELAAGGDLGEVLEAADVAITAVPTQFIRSTLTPFAASLRAIDLVVSLSKGLEVETLETPVQILAELLAGPAGPLVVALSGPSFAREVAEDHPTALVAAGPPRGTAQTQELLSRGRVRVYRSDDVIGVELGGALKNVIAIAAGVVDALEYGGNTRAALIARGLAEISRLGTAMGGNPLTFAGLSGLGDLVLTCTGDLSRNRRIGLGIGRGEALDSILETQEVAEGVRTVVAVRQLAQKTGVDMPITEEVYSLIYEGKDPRQSMSDLLGRAFRHELE